jgi:hypothetical protein
METYLPNKEFTMPDVLAYDTPIRPIKPGDRLPPSDQPAPAPPPARAAFIDELHKIFAGLLGR